MYFLYIIVLVTYVMVKGQATQKKPWQQGETAPTILQMEKPRRVRELDDKNKNGRVPSIFRVR